ncbi:hypothetical protein [Lysobacter enzymogenes]|uniref:hypothetical protein n=1 Tax=Lysobacter enzymogenes TaxID=69 RepID=UPI00089471C2|nr:hypothetical protein [Lysobacter enzymogenes]SDW51902.1 hypothetical protein SAMN05421681_10298 [Lysobacter enzymogenes]
MDTTFSRPRMFLPSDEPMAFAIVSELMETALRQCVAPLVMRNGAGFRAIDTGRDWLWREDAASRMYSTVWSSCQASGITSAVRFR